MQQTEFVFPLKVGEEQKEHVRGVTLPNLLMDVTTSTMPSQAFHFIFIKTQISIFFKYKLLCKTLLNLCMHAANSSLIIDHRTELQIINIF